MSSRAKSQPPRPVSPVVELDAVREKVRLKRYLERVKAAVEQNRSALQRLFETGLVYSRTGSRVGRDLLLAHQHLLRVSDVIQKAQTAPAPRTAREVDALLAEVESLLDRTGVIARRHHALFQDGREA